MQEQAFGRSDDSEIPEKIEKYYYETKEVIVGITTIPSAPHQKQVVYLDGGLFDVWCEKDGNWNLVQEGLKGTYLPHKFQVPAIFKFDYCNTMSPLDIRLLAFGIWYHPNTYHRLLCGINLTYLDTNQEERLLNFSGSLFRKYRSVKGRYDYLESVHPEIIKVAYRTYDDRWIDNLTEEVIT